MKDSGGYPHVPVRLLSAGMSNCCRPSAPWRIIRSGVGLLRNQIGTRENFASCFTARDEESIGSCSRSIAMGFRFSPFGTVPRTCSAPKNWDPRSLPPLAGLIGEAVAVFR
jgi:hypothetical protein